MDLSTLLSAISSPSTFITLETETKPSKKKGGEGLVKISTHKSVSVGRSLDYDRIKGNREERMNLDPTETGPRQWGEKIDGLIVENNGEHYLTVYFTEASSSCSQFLLNGSPVTKEEISHLLPKVSPSPHGMEYRNFKLSSIKSVTVNGNKFM